LRTLSGPATVSYSPLGHPEKKGGKEHKRKRLMESFDKKRKRRNNTTDTDTLTQKLFGCRQVDSIVRTDSIVPSGRLLAIKETDTANLHFQKNKKSQSHREK
jgi:hypothetical protein